MTISALGFRALTMALATAILGGCGAQSVTNPVTEWIQKSWMLPETKGDDLLYTSNDTGDVYVYSYPALKFSGTAHWTRLRSDTRPLR